MEVRTPEWCLHLSTRSNAYTILVEPDPFSGVRNVRRQKHFVFGVVSSNGEQGGDYYSLVVSGETAHVMIAGGFSLYFSTAAKLEPVSCLQFRRLRISRVLRKSIKGGVQFL